MKTNLFILGLLLSSATVFGQWNPTPFMRDYGNHRTNAIDARIGISALGTNDAVPLGFIGALTVTTNGSGVVIAAISITPATLNIRPGNGLTTLGDGTNVANNRLEIYDTASRNVLIQSAGSSFLNGGNVGIGTNMPQQALHVTGTVRATAFEDQNGNPISGGGGGGDVKTNANNTYTPQSTNNFSALTTFSNAVVVAGTAQFPLLSPSTLYGGDGGRNLISYGPGNGINIGGGLVIFSGTNSNWTTPDDYIAVSDSNGKLTNRTPITIVFVSPGLSVGTVGSTNYVTNTFPATNYVFLSPGLVTTVSGTTVTVSNSASGGAAQTPWLQDEDAAGFRLTNAFAVDVVSTNPVLAIRPTTTNDHSMDVVFSARNQNFLPGAVAVIRPSSLIANQRSVLDLVTVGSPTNRPGVGVAWIDIVDTNLASVDLGNFETARIGKFKDGPAYVAAAAGGTGTVRPLTLNQYGGTVVVNSTNKAAVTPGTCALSVTSTGNAIAVNYDDGTGAFAVNGFSDGSWRMSDWFGGAYTTSIGSSNGQFHVLNGRMAIWGDSTVTPAPSLYFRSLFTNSFDLDVRYGIRTNLGLGAATATLTPATTNLNQRIAFNLMTKGAPTDVSGVGVSWFEAIETNETGVVNGTFESLRMGKFVGGPGYVSTVAGGSGGTIRPLLLNHKGGTVVINSTNKQAAFPATAALIVESTGNAVTLGYDDGTPTLAINPQSDGSSKIFDYAGGGTAVLSIMSSNGIVFHNKTAVFTNSFFIKSNAISAWPTGPRTAGDAYFGNSNGTIYVLCSGTGNTWTKTNLVATP